MLCLLFWWDRRVSIISALFLEILVDAICATSEYTGYRQRRVGALASWSSECKGWIERRVRRCGRLNVLLGFGLHGDGCGRARGGVGIVQSLWWTGQVATSGRRLVVTTCIYTADQRDQGHDGETTPRAGLTGITEGTTRRWPTMVKLHRKAAKGRVVLGLYKFIGVG